jgi:general secretion pathway protein G
MTQETRDDKESGFTLVELLVVLVILALLAALVGPKVIGYMSSSRVKTASIQINAYKSVLEMYHLDMGRYPQTSDGLEALAKAPQGATGWAGPYLDKAVAVDPWGNPYAYTAAADGSTYTLRSFGADGKEGGEGDNADIAP